MCRTLYVVQFIFSGEEEGIFSTSCTVAVAVMNSTFSVNGSINAFFIPLGRQSDKRPSGENRVFRPMVAISNEKFMSPESKGPTDGGLSSSRRWG